MTSVPIQNRLSVCLSRCPQALLPPQRLFKARQHPPFLVTMHFLYLEKIRAASHSRTTTADPGQISASSLSACLFLARTVLRYRAYVARIASPQSQPTAVVVGGGVLWSAALSTRGYISLFIALGTVRRQVLFCSSACNVIKVCLPSQFLSQSKLTAQIE